MNEQYRTTIYAFLSRIMSDIPDKQLIKELQKNDSLLETIGENAFRYLHANSVETLFEKLNEEYSSLFVLNAQPVESFVLDAKNETLVGRQNPVMAFYFQHGFELNMDQTDLMAPDHLGIELAFMQTLVFRGERQAQTAFLEEHLLTWVVPYMLGMKHMATTPFYKDLCDFMVEFLVADYDYLKSDVA